MGAGKGQAIREGRKALGRRAWAEAFERLSEADAEHPLPAGELDRLATAAYLSGQDEASAEARARAHLAFLEAGEVEEAVRCAFWLGFGLLMKGEHARGGGWIQRARRLLQDRPGGSPFRGYLLLPEGLRHLARGEPELALEAFQGAVAEGDRHGEEDLVALGRLGLGQALIRTGKVDEGVALLDEVMVAVENDELSPVVAGTIYCAVIEACQEIFDLRRAGEWTDALSRWCESQPELVPFRGQCLVRRAEIMELRGSWTNALEEARQARDRLVGPPGEPAAGAAYYRTAEILRLRGEFAEAQTAYTEAATWGASPQPGLGLLRLAQGQVGAARASVGLALDGARDRAARARLLPAWIEIEVAAGELDRARAAAAELAETAGILNAPLVRASAVRGAGWVRLEEGDAREALVLLQEALSLWEELDAPYKAARTRVLIGLACRVLGDGDSCEIEFESARRVFEALGAAPDLRRLEDVSRPGAAGPHGLSPRELQVLRRIASGQTNRDIARGLFISERTVERHASNIFRKLRVSSRSGATAYAYEHDLM